MAIILSSARRLQVFIRPPVRVLFPKEKLHQLFHCNYSRCICYKRGYMYAFLGGKYTDLSKSMPFTCRLTSAVDGRAGKFQHSRYFQSHNILLSGKERVVDEISFDKLSDETLDELEDFFAELGDSGLCNKDFDCSLASGVLTVQLGGNGGTYVINKQSPNKQIWISSPVSGPKRYDIIDGRWRYNHDGVALHDLLTEEFSKALGTQVDFSQLEHSHLLTDGDNWAK